MSKPRKIGLRCLACGRTFTQRAAHLFYDLGTVARKRRGEQVPFSEFFVPTVVTCPYCQAEDRYDLSAWQLFRTTLALLLTRWFPPGPDSWMQAHYLGTGDGRILHPFEMRDWYAQQVARHPQKLELRVRYANTLRSQGRLAEAEVQFRAALDLSPRQTEALINLVALLVQRGQPEEAMDYVRRLASIKPKNEKQRWYVSIAQELMNGTLPLEELEISSPMLPVPRQPK